MAPEGTALLPLQRSDVVSSARARLALPASRATMIAQQGRAVDRGCGTRSLSRSSSGRRMPPRDRRPVRLSLIAPPRGAGLGFREAVFGPRTAVNQAASAPPAAATREALIRWALTGESQRPPMATASPHVGALPGLLDGSQDERCCRLARERETCFQSCSIVSVTPVHFTQ